LYPKRSLHIFLFLVFVVLGSTARAQSNEPSDALFKTVQSLDTQLFDAYNHCDRRKAAFSTQHSAFSQLRASHEAAKPRSHAASAVGTA
jgi:hypothetical protein